MNSDKKGEAIFLACFKPAKHRYTTSLTASSSFVSSSWTRSAKQTKETSLWASSIGIYFRNKSREDWGRGQLSFSRPRPLSSRSPLARDPNPARDPNFHAGYKKTLGFTVMSGVRNSLLEQNSVSQRLLGIQLKDFEDKTKMLFNVPRFVYEMTMTL